MKEEIHEELDIGEEQVSSNECWDEDEDEIYATVYSDLDSGEEPVASNECFEHDEDAYDDNEEEQ